MSIDEAAIARNELDPDAAVARGPAVVFIHGFTATADVWSSFLTLLRSDSSMADFELLTMRYPTRLCRLSWKRAIPSLDHIADYLDTFLTLRLEPSQPLIVVSHSQGGLVVQRFISNLLERGRALELRRVMRVVMFSCPNEGSQFLLLTRRLLLRRNPQERTLRPLDETIANTRRTVLYQAILATEVTSTSCPVSFTAFY
jgi:pimeloyl-ACP methyl ester carboxylesterase